MTAQMQRTGENNAWNRLREFGENVKDQVRKYSRNTVNVSKSSADANKELWAGLKM